MKYYNYEDLSIESSKKPHNIHLWWEVSSSLWFMVDSTNQLVLLKSINKGSSWSIVTTRSHKIQSGWNDGTYIWLVDCDNDGTADDFDVWKITVDGNDTITSIGTSSGADINTVYAYDIFKIGTDVFVINHEKSGGVDFLFIVWDVDTAPFTKKDDLIAPASGSITDVGYGVVNGSMYYVGFSVSIGLDLYIIIYNNSTTTLSFSSKLDDQTLSEDNRSLHGIAFDGTDTLYLTNEQLKLITYSINGDSWTVKGDYVLFMLDRNTASGVMEKAFHITEPRVYQLHPYVSHQLYYIAHLGAGNVIIGITDNFLMLNGGEMYEYTDHSNYMTRIEFAHEIMNYSEGTLGVRRDRITIEKGMFMQIEGKYTSAGSSSDKVIFEGIVVDFDGELLTKVWLESPAKKELKEKKPRGDFSGRSDEIMASLVATYCKYVTIGTLSTGTAMGTISYAGDKSLMTIFNELALFEKWIWKLDPQGRLYFNDGTIDSLVDLSETDKVWNVKSGEIRAPYNYFYVKGAIVNGVQLHKEIEAEDDLTSQQLHGFNPYEKTFASFNSQSVLNQLTTNIKAKLKEIPLVVEHWHYDVSLGMIAICETVTFVYDTTNVNILSDQFLINRVLFKAQQNAGGYTIADKLI